MPVMLKAIHCDTHEHIFRHLTSLEQESEMRTTPNALLWLDLQSPSEQELAKLGQEFQLHPLAIEDATREHQRPKVEEYESFYFVVFYSVSLNANSPELDICELDMFLGKNYLITVHNGHILELDEVEQRWTRNVNQLEWGVGVLLYTLLDTIVDRYFPVVDEMVNQAEELEDQLFTGAVRDRKSTRLNSSHSQISYAVFCLKKKKKKEDTSKTSIRARRVLTRYRCVT